MVGDDSVLALLKSLERLINTYYYMWDVTCRSLSLHLHKGDLVEEALPGENEPEKVERVRYNYGIIIESDATENRQKEMVNVR